jgi:hypothetical protein
MNSSQNSSSLRSTISVSPSNRGKYQSVTKLQDLTTTKINEATPNQYTTLILIAAGRQKIGRRILEHFHKKGIWEILTKDSCRAAKEAEHEITAETLTHSNLCTACTMAAKRTTAPKIAPFFLSRKEKWSKIPHSLRSNPLPMKSTTPRNGLHITSNILHPILRFHHKPTKTTKTILQHTTNPTIITQSIILNLRQFGK